MKTAQRFSLCLLYHKKQRSRQNVVTSLTESFITGPVYRGWSYKTFIFSGKILYTMEQIGYDKKDNMHNTYEKAYYWHILSVQLEEPAWKMSF
jgi:hypothetical protein